MIQQQGLQCFGSQKPSDMGQIFSYAKAGLIDFLKGKESKTPQVVYFIGSS